MKIRLSRSILPNLFTVLNIFFGFLCIIQAMHGKFVLAGIYVVCSAICDTLDGLMARLTHSSSEFGVQLDSLADAVSFGAAPSVLVYALFLHSYGPFGTLVASAPLVFGALRLARFNVQLVGFSKDSFVGVPIPLSALVLVAFIFFFGPDVIQADATLQHVFTAVIAACGLLMVSTIRYPTLPKFTRKAFREQPWLTGGCVLGGIIIAVTLGKGLFPVLALVIVAGVVYSAYGQIRKLLTGKPAGKSK
ncbi:MAG: CDP-diacylglycerol--serine O-phosphatidyltransferase [Ignavibacteria bacterium]|nr:CDP-diacylglycerol--serine O-phosphatidyltransferase [Ignavibacteria bacterium]